MNNLRTSNKSFWSSAVARQRHALVLALGLPVLALSIAACNNEPGKDKAKAQVAEPSAATVAQPATAAAKTSTLKFSNEGSKVEYVGAKVTRKHEGAFGKFNGTIQNVDGDPTKSSVDFEVDVASITSDDPKLTGHLKTADFFDVEKFPKAKFKSTSIKAGGDKGATHTVTGNLELHGVTKAITFPATIKLEGDTAETKAEFVINRKDFGLVYPGMANDLIKDDVLIKLDVHAKKSEG